MLASSTRGAFIHGGVWVGLGLLMILFPPKVRISKWWLAGGLVLLAGTATAFLPMGWFGMPEWRSALEQLGLRMGDRVSAQPGISLEFWLELVVAVIGAWYVMGHRISDRPQLTLALLIAVGIAIYGVVSMLAYGAKPAWSWDPKPTFGIYGNRNHTATVLVMGALTSLGVIMESIRAKRGGTGGAAALSLTICLWGLLGYSVSRAGVLLLGLGVVCWIAGLGRRYLSGKALITCLVFLAAVGGIFWFADSKAKQRVQKQLELIQAKAEAAGDQGDGSADSDLPASAKSVEDDMANQPLDFRLLIYKDTLRMLKDGPWPGIGLGQFVYVFPQYRHDSIHKSRCWHPESNWLLLAAEAGWPVAVITASGVAALFWVAFRSARRRHHGWALASGTLLAALAVPLHGLVDVPAYHVGIAWTALVLVAMNFRIRNSPESEGGTLSAGAFGRWSFRLGGVVILTGGVCLLISLSGGGTLAQEQPFIVAEKSRALIALDDAQRQDPANNPAQLNPDGTPVDHTEVAQGMVNEALKVVPMEPELSFLRGLLSIYYVGEDGITAEAFAIQRKLLPDWVDPAYRQGLALVKVFPDKAKDCWREALRRSRVSLERRKGGDDRPDVLLRHMRVVVKGLPAAEQVVSDLEKEARQ